MFKALPYLSWPVLCGDTAEDARALFLANGKEETLGHSARVAETCASLARAVHLDGDKAVSSGLLHDIAAIVRPVDMMDYAFQAGWHIDDAEKAHPFLLHQRVSAEIAREILGIGDQDVLSAIACHTTLKANPTKYDMLLFLADKISWDQDGASPYAREITVALERSLESACLAYIDYVIEHGMILHPHSWLLDARDGLRALL